jgi:hypothetical protein
MEVQHEHVRACAAQERPELGIRGGASDQLEARLPSDDGLDPGADSGLIVEQRDAHRRVGEGRHLDPARAPRRCA